jgi:hypothetical protein
MSREEEVEDEAEEGKGLETGCSLAERYWSGVRVAADERGFEGLRGDE